jgi:hypothetical protein
MTVTTAPVADGTPAANGPVKQGWPRAAFELVFVTGAAFTYLVVRAATGGSAERAIENAGRLVRLERMLRLYVEPDMQRIVVGHGHLVSLANTVYIWGYWPVIATVAIWLYLRHPATYYHCRNAFLLSGSIGLITFMVFPVAPPRLAGLGFVDTVTLHSNAYRLLQPPDLVNQYAAMPSFHFGWLVVLGVTLNRESRVALVRVFGILMPSAMLVAIIVTGNHFVLDAVVGATLSLAALAVVSRLPSRPAIVLFHRLPARTSPPSRTAS